MEVEGFLEWQLTQAFGLVHTVTSSGEQAGIVHLVILTSEHLCVSIHVHNCKLSSKLFLPLALNKASHQYTHCLEDNTKAME